MKKFWLWQVPTIGSTFESLSSSLSRHLNVEQVRTDFRPAL
jgi:hypothetical protein